MSRIYPKIAQNFIAPLYDLARGTSRFKYGQILQKSQWLSQDQLEKIQWKSLGLLIAHAYENVPYYHRVFREKNLKPSDIKNFDDLKKIPILTKDDIRQNYKELIARDYPQNQLIRYRSGGTGNPIRFFITKDQLSWELAAEFRAYGWAGYNFGDRCYMFWGSPVDKSKYKTRLGNFTKMIERISVSDTYLISDSILEKFAQDLTAFNPEIIRGYTTSIFIVAKYLLENNITSIRPKAVITTAETLFDSTRKVIEEAFGCSVFDYYGSRELGALAAECEEHCGYHVSAENVLIEFEKDGEHVASGEKGATLLTSLRNFGMPFIRYRNGDVGIPSDESCSCGRGLPLISSIEGRVADFLAVYDKKKDTVVPVGPVYPLFELAGMHVPLEHYQVIQESIDNIVIKIVKGEGYSKQDTDFLVKYLKQLVGEDVNVTIDFVDYIPPSPSGKRSPVISKVNSFF